MATIAETTRIRFRIGDIYTWTALGCVLTAFLGFLPTFWMPLSAGKFEANPVVFFHGVGFFTWTLFALAQTSLVPTGRVTLHREVGLAGISFATLLTVLALLAALNALQSGIAAGQAAGAEAFLIVPLTVIATFAVLFVFAIANIRRKEFHKRLMLLATISVLNAPVARPLIVWVFKFPPPPAQLPVWIDYPACYLSYLLFVPALIHDWRTRGRIHPVYLIAVPILIIIPLAVMPISDSAAWHGFAKGFAALAGTHKPG
jgi:hypothetical protein